MLKHIYFAIFALFIIGCSENNNPIDVEGQKVSIEISADSLDFGMIDSVKTIFLSNTRSQDLEWNITSDLDWVTVNPSQGTLIDSDTLTVFINRVGLAGGDYSGSLMINSVLDSEPQKIFIKMQVPASSLQISVDTLDFGMFDSVKTLYLSHKGYSELEWNITSNVNWAIVNKNQGSLSDKDSVKISLNKDGLKEGEFYTGTLTLNSNTGLDPVDICIKMQVPFYGVEKIASGRIYNVFRSYVYEFAPHPSYEFKILLKQDEYILASAIIDINGYYSFKNISLPNQDLLVNDPLYYSIGDSSNIKISDQNAMMCVLSLEIYWVDNERYYPIAIANDEYWRIYSNASPGYYAEGAIIAEILYYDRDLTINGATPPIKTGTSPYYGNVYHKGFYNISFKKGINIWISYLSKIVDIGDAGYTFEYNYLNSLPDGASPYKFCKYY